MDSEVGAYIYSAYILDKFSITFNVDACLTGDNHDSRECQSTNRQQVNDAMVPFFLFKRH